MKPITITITKKDWHKDIDYKDPCACLLHAAAKRRFHDHSIFVMPGVVSLFRRKRSGFVEVLRAMIYSERKYESRLKAAHSNPKLLPMKIVLK